MRCKNCGADNDDNRYICEVCGSPLYDEDDFDNAANDDNDKTQTFKAVNGENYQPQNNNNNNNNNDGRKPGGNRPKGSIGTALLITLAIVLLVNWIYGSVSKSQYTQTSFSDFLAAKDAGQLSEVEIQSDRIIYMLSLIHI